MNTTEYQGFIKNFVQGRHSYISIYRISKYIRGGREGTYIACSMYDSADMFRGVWGHGPQEHFTL